MLKKAHKRITGFLDARFSKKQQVLGIFSILLVILIVCITILITGDTNVTKESGTNEQNEETVGSGDGTNGEGTIEEGLPLEEEKPMNPEDVPEDEFYVVDPEEGTSPIGMDGPPEDEFESFMTRLEGTTEINIDALTSTNPVLVDSSENLLLFIGHAGVLTVYNKKEKAFTQIDNPISTAKISDDEKYIVFVRQSALESKLFTYSMESKLMEEILEKQNEYFTDVEMKKGTIFFVHHVQDTTKYNLETFPHFDYREGRLPQELHVEKVVNVGPKLYQNEETVYYYNRDKQSIHGFYPGLHQPEIVKVEAKEPSEFAVNGKSYALVDAEKLKTNDGTIDTSSVVNSVNYRNNTLYFTYGTVLYQLTKGKEVLLATDVTTASSNKVDITFQQLDTKVFTWK